MQLLGIYLVTVRLGLVMCQKTYWWMGTNAFGGQQLEHMKVETETKPGIQKYSKIKYKGIKYS